MRAVRAIGLLCVCGLAAATISGCSEEGIDCTAADCSDGVTLDGPTFRAEFDRPLTVRACVEGRCGESKADASTVPVGVPIPTDRERVVVSITVTDADGRVLLESTGVGRVEIVRPNGADCPPECRFVRVTSRTGRLVPSEA
jgi:hypothetical protein